MANSNIPKLTPEQIASLGLPSGMQSAWLDKLASTPLLSNDELRQLEVTGGGPATPAPSPVGPSDYDFGGSAEFTPGKGLVSGAKPGYVPQTIASAPVMQQRPQAEEEQAKQPAVDLSPDTLGKLERDIKVRRSGLEAASRDAIQETEIQAEEKRRAIYGATDAQRKASDAEAKEFADHVQRISDERAKQEERETIFRKSEELAEKALEDAKTRYREQPEIRDRRGLGSRLMGAIAIGLGAYAQALTRTGDNIGLRMVEQGIDEDLEAQKIELSKKRGNIDIAVNQLDRLRMKYKDDVVATQAKRLEDLEYTKAKVATYQAKYKGSEIEANAQGMIAQLDDEMTKTKMNLQQYLYDKGQTDIAMRSQILGMREQKSAMEQERLGKIAEMIAAEQQRIADLGVRGLVPQPGAKVSEKDTNDAKDIVSSSNVLQTELDKLMNLRNDGNMIIGNDKATASSIVGSLALTIKTLEKTGTLDKGSVEVFEQILGNPSSIGFQLARMKAAKDHFMLSASNKLKVLGFSPESLRSYGAKAVSEEVGFKPDQ